MPVVGVRVGFQLEAGGVGLQFTISRSRQPDFDVVKADAPFQLQGQHFIPGPPAEIWRCFGVP